MSGAPAAGWRFLPPDAAGADDLGDAAREGPAALARALRFQRARIGSARTAARLRVLPLRHGRPLRLLLAAPIQPQALVDAVAVAFGMAGFAVEISAVEGLAALRDRKDSRADVDLAVLVDPSDGAEPDAALLDLASDLASRVQVPVALVRFGEDIAEASLAPAVDGLTIGIPAGLAFDRRFAASFGTIPTPAAADAIADAAAAWAARRTGQAPKLLVTDLDGTLWAGVLGEGGAAAPALHGTYAAALKTLVGRGLVVAVASRNEPADVEAAFASGAAGPLGRGDVSAAAVGWEDKAALVAEVLADLGLGAEHAVFVDDDPVNCAKVAARFPAMDVRLFAGDPDAFARALLADPLLVGGGPEGGERAGRYRAKAEVDRLRRDAPDVGAFLAALGTRLTLVPLAPRHLRRAAELAGRVNQFVLRDERPSVPELEARRSPFDRLVRLDDAFGAHGIVGMMLARREGEVLVLDNLHLSCRALERGIEDAMLRALAALAREAGIAAIVGRLEALPRNAPARAFVARAANLAADGAFVYPVGEDAAPPETVPRIEWAQAEDGDEP